MVGNGGSTRFLNNRQARCQYGEKSKGSSIKKRRAMILTKEEATQQIAMAGKEESKTLRLKEVTFLTEEAASLLAAFNGNKLDLNGLTTLDASSATALRYFRGESYRAERGNDTRCQHRNRTRGFPGKLSLSQGGKRGERRE
jgi:hypothetical protein